MPRPKNRPSKPPPPFAASRRRPRRGPETEQLLLYGVHAVEAALANPARPIGRVLATENAARRLEAPLRARGAKPELVLPRQLDRLVGSDAVHQGVVLETAPLPPIAIDEVKAEGILIVLDQVTDPHNVGAVLRSAAAFGAAGLVMPERHSPPLAGALAKAASGALDVVPVILVGNLAQALGELGKRGFWRVGFGRGRRAKRSRRRPSLCRLPSCLAPRAKASGS